MRRAVIYFHFDPQDRVERYVLRALAGLAPCCERVLVVSNSRLGADGVQALRDAGADEVLLRANEGLDVGAYRDALAHLGRAYLGELDELIMTNHTYFAPLRPWQEVLAQADSWDDVDFWGITAHREMQPHPFLDAPVMPAHLSSHWLAVRRRLLHDPGFEHYWRTMPAVHTYRESIQWHESRFTAHFESLGFRSRAMFASERYDADNPAVERPLELLEDGCPLLKRRALFHDPLHQELGTADGREVLAAAVARGYDEDLMISSIVRAAPGRDVVANLGLTQVLSETAPDQGRPPTPGAAIMWAEDDDGLRIAALAARSVPDEWPLTLLRPDATSDDVLAEGPWGDRAVDVVSATGSPTILGALSAVGSDALRGLPPDAPVLLLALPAQGRRPGRAARRALDSLAAAPGMLRSAGALLAGHAGLGMVVPAADHAGTGVLGHGWKGRRDAAVELARRAGVVVPLDESTPIAPYDGVCLLRAGAIPALAPLARAAAADADDVADLLISAALAGDGWHTRQCLSAARVASAYSLLEFKYQALASSLPADAEEQVPYLRARTSGVRGLGALVRTSLEQRSPGTADRLKPLYRRLRRIARPRPPRT